MLAETRKKFTVRRLFSLGQIAEAVWLATYRINPVFLTRNPVLFIVWMCAALVTAVAVYEWIFPTQGVSERVSDTFFAVSLAVWLWLLLWMANFSEALAEERGKAQATTLRSTRQEILAKRIRSVQEAASPELVLAGNLKKGDLILIEPGDMIPADARVVDGVASVDESAVTGESAPVVRSPDEESCLIVGGTRVLSDRLIARVNVDQGDSFLDKMIMMVDGARRRRTPNEVALSILLTAMTAVLLLACATLVPFSIYSVNNLGYGSPIRIITVIAFFVCVIPTTIAGLLSTISVAGMGRMMKANVIAMSGRAVEAAGDVDILLLDKTGTITVGNREAIGFVPVKGVSVTELAQAAAAASIADETPEGYSITRLAKQRYNISLDINAYRGAKFVSFSAQTRMSGIDFEGNSIRKGALSAIGAWLAKNGAEIPSDVDQKAISLARRGSTPLLVSSNDRILGIIELKDVIKTGIKERFGQLRKMGIRTVMVTGDNKYTAAAIAAEAGLDDFVGEADPAEKLNIIKRFQSEGRLVAMSGDGTNDAPALAKADVAVVMENGTQAAKEAGNMIDLDSSPTKLIEIIEIGKQMLLTRGAITTFSVSNDIAVYFSIIPAAFASVYPELDALNILRLSSPVSAVLSAVIFNVLIMFLLIPVAIRGVNSRSMSPMRLLRRNILFYGVGGLIVPFVLIKLIDMLLFFLGIY